jgi:hypothetical protein
MSEKWHELTFIERFTERIRDGTEIPFSGEHGTGAWWF